MGSYDTPDRAWDVATSGDITYVADDTTGLIILDTSDPENPNYISRYNTPALARGITIVDSIAFIADLSSVQIINISDPENPTFMGYYDTPSEAYGITVANSIAYIADGFSGLQILDVSDPFDPIFLGNVDTPGKAYKVAVSNSIACVADWGSGLQIINISNPENPILLTNYITPDHARSVVMSDNIAYVAAFGSGLQIIDLSDPMNPILLSSYDTVGFSYGIFLSGTTIYLADDGYGINLLDVTNPEQPSLIGSYMTPGSARSVTNSGLYSYVADDGSGLQIIDVSNPENPELLFTFQPHTDTRMNCKPIIISNILIVADNAWNEIFSFDISDPATPILIDSYPWNLSSTDIAVYNDFLITTNERYGINIHDLEQITDTDKEIIISPNSILSNYPNPFNPKTTISFSIYENSEVNLTIYNLKGQKVKTLINDRFRNEDYSIIWNGKNKSGKQVSSGTYFYQLLINGKTESVKKCLLIKKKKAVIMQNFHSKKSSLFKQFYNTFLKFRFL